MGDQFTLAFCKFDSGAIAFSRRRLEDIITLTHTALSAELFRFGASQILEAAMELPPILSSLFRRSPSVVARHQGTDLSAN